MKHVGTRGDPKDIASQEQLGGGGGGVVISDTPPASPTPGLKWVDGNGIEWTWIEDGTSAQWVELGPGPGPSVSAVIHAAGSKSAPDDADEFGAADSTASWGLAKITWANIKSALLTYLKGEFREKLTAPRTYYVRTDGSDSNTGLSNTAGGAFATMQQAWDTLATLDGGGFVGTIQVADGTHTTPFEPVKVPVGFSSIVVVGNNTTPGLCHLSTAATCISVGPGINLSVMGLRLTSASSSQVLVSAGSICTVSDIELSAAAGNYQLFANGGTITVTGAVHIDGGGAGFALAQTGGYVSVVNASFALIGTVPYAVFMTVRDVSRAVFFNTSFSGSATGSRYSAELNGTINTYGAGESFLPGNAAGTKATGGQYA